jgi:hypothetical protein
MFSTIDRLLHLLGKALTQGTRDQIDDAAGRLRQDELYRVQWVVLRMRKGRQHPGKQQESRCSKEDACLHSASPA